MNEKMINWCYPGNEKACQVGLLVQDLNFYWYEHPMEENG
jgi:hypothetical protein